MKVLGVIALAASLLCLAGCGNEPEFSYSFDGPMMKITRNIDGAHKWFEEKAGSKSSGSGDRFSCLYVYEGQVLALKVLEAKGAYSCESMDWLHGESYIDVIGEWKFNSNALNKVFGARY